MSEQPWKDQTMFVPRIEELKVLIVTKRGTVSLAQQELNQLEQELRDHNESQFLAEYTDLCNKYRMKISATSRDGDAELFVEDVASTQTLTAASALEKY